MRIASKSAMAFPRSNGLERYKMSSSPAGPAVAGCRDLRPLRGRWRLPVFPVSLGAASRGSEGGSYPNLRGPDERRFCAHRGKRATPGLVGRDRSCREHLALVGLDQLHVEAQRLQLTNEHVEGFRHTRLNGRFAFDDGLVNLGTAIDVIGLRGEQFLQDVGCAVGFQGPHFHFAEALTAELRLAAQRLLGDERVRSDRPRVYLVV